MRPGLREPAPHPPDPERSGESEVLQVARRQGYQDGLVAVGVPYAEAARRAMERYP